MVNRRDTAGSGDGVGGFLGRLNTALENRIAMLFVAAVLGAGGGVGFIKANPEARSDPFTLKYWMTIIVDQRLSVPREYVCLNRIAHAIKRK